MRDDYQESRANCDKCDKYVEPANNAVYWNVLFWALEHHKEPRRLMQEYLNDPAFAIGMWSRHLLPTENCEGSPSRAAFLEGIASSNKILEPEKIAHGKEAYRLLRLYFAPN